MIVNILGYELYFDLWENETLSNIIRDNGYYSKHDINILSTYLKNGGYFIDVGANIGWYTIIASKLIGDNGKVITFEPEPNNCRILNKNIHNNGCDNININTLGLGDESGIVPFYLNPENFGDHSISSTTHLRCFNPKDPKEIKVSMIRLDTYLDIDEFKKVGLIKLDVQGSEAKALRGMARLLEKYKPPILMEYSPAHLYSAGSSPFEIFAIIDIYNYKINLINLDGSLSLINFTDLDKITGDHFDTFTGVDLLLYQ